MDTRSASPCTPGAPALASSRLRPAVTVRPARPDELDAVGRLTVEVYVAGGFASPGYLGELRDAASRARDAELLVAERDGDVVGTVTLALAGRYAELADASRGEAEFRMLAVSPSARGGGVGAALVSACLDRARAAGRTRMLLSTEPEMHAAHRLYARLGFRPEPALDWSPVPGVDLQVWARPLEDALRRRDRGCAARR